MRAKAILAADGSQTDVDGRRAHSGSHGIRHAPIARRRGPRYAFEAFGEIAEYLLRAERRVLLLDLDGTLVALRRRPEDVRVSLRARKTLARLADLPGTSVAVLSGRNARDLEKLVDVKSLRYFGLHGGEAPNKRAKISRDERKALAHAKRSAKQEFDQLSGIDVEDKGPGFTVHYRGANEAAVREANRALMAIMAPLRHALHLLNGKKVWEVLPHSIPGKGTAIKNFMANAHDAALAYIGDDEPDEPAFAALEEHVTIHVGRNADTHAKYYLRNPGEVLRFLGMLAEALRSEK